MRIEVTGGIKFVNGKGNLLDQIVDSLPSAWKRKVQQLAFARSTKDLLNALNSNTPDEQFKEVVKNWFECSFINLDSSEHVSKLSRGILVRASHHKWSIETLKHSETNPNEFKFISRLQEIPSAQLIPTVVFNFLKEGSNDNFGIFKSERKYSNMALMLLQLCVNQQNGSLFNEIFSSVLDNQKISLEEKNRFIGSGIRIGLAGKSNNLSKGLNRNLKNFNKSFLNLVVNHDLVGNFTSQVSSWLNRGFSGQMAIDYLEVAKLMEDKNLFTELKTVLLNRNDMKWFLTNNASGLLVLD
jgi:hypothetical protein